MPEQASPSGKKGRILSILALSFFLVFLPLGSYIYLKKGYEYQKEAMKDLRKEQRLTDLKGLTLLSGEVPLLEIGESFYLMGILPESADKVAYAKVLNKLHEQFDLPENIEFWTVFAQADAGKSNKFQTDYDIPVDSSQLLYWTADSPEQFQDFIDRLALRPEEQAALGEGLVVLMDDSLYVRQAYSVNDQVALQRLVERTAILLPERGKPKPELRREAEM